MSFRLKLLGSFAIAPLGNSAPVGKLNRKTCALLAYLATTSQRHSRQTLAEWFCQDAKDPGGTLRWHLSQIKRKVSPDLLDVNRQTAVINSDLIHCDHRQFATVINNLPTITTEELATAVSLYRGPFLAELTLKNAPEFELWQMGQQSHWQRLYEKGGTALVLRHIAEAQYQDAINVAQNLLQSNPLLETVQAQLIWLYAQTGQRQAALRQFAHCQTLLEEELAVEPTAELLALHQAIAQNQPLPTILPEAVPTQVPATAAPTRFIGRAQELAHLEALAQNGRAVALINGAAGSGKTQLVQKFGSTLPAFTQLSGRCYETTRTVPYHPWQTILQQQLNNLGTEAVSQLAPYWRQQLGMLLPQLGETAVSPTQQQLFRAIVHLLTALDKRPRLIFVDDLQWADEVSLQLFQFMAEQLNQAAGPLLLIGTFRSEEAAENPALVTLQSDLARQSCFSRLTLPPFAEAETEQLIAALWQQLPEGFRTPHMRDMLLQATGGNPLYMTEILQELTLAETLPTDLPLPPSLADLIGRRLGQLPESGRQVIESLAILDQPAPFALAQQVSARSEEETVTALEKGLHWRLLRWQANHLIDFSHDLMQTAVLQLISPIRQQRLHRRAAQTLGQTGAAEATIAYHWGQAGDREKEAEYAVLAALKATQLYAVDDAIAFYQRAIPHLANAGEKLAAMRQLGRLYQRISEWELAQQILDEGLAASQPHTADAARFQILLGQLYSRQSHYQQALDILQDAYQTCQRLEDPDILAQCAGSIGIVHYFRDDYDKSLACYEEALAFAREQADEENVDVWLSNIAVIYLQTGAYEQALSHLQSGLALQKRLGNQEQTAVVLGNLGGTYCKLGNYQQAVVHHSEAAHLRYEWGDRAGVATNLRDLGVDYAEVGQTEAALTCFWQALTLDVALARRDACGINLGEIGCLLARQNEPALALQALTTAVTLLRLTHSRYYLSRFMLEQITLLWPQSDWQTIETLLEEATQLAEAIDQSDLLFQCGVMAIKLQAAQQKITLETAVIRLTKIPANDEAEAAAIGYAIWQIDPSQETWRQETAVRYQNLYQQAPQQQYRQRLIELTETEHPVPPTLPESPRLITPLATELTPFLKPLDSLLSR